MSKVIKNKQSLGNKPVKTEKEIGGQGFLKEPSNQCKKLLVDRTEEYIGIEQNDREERIDTVIEAAKKYLGVSSSESKAIFKWWIH